MKKMALTPESRAFDEGYQVGFEAGKKAALQWQDMATAPKDGTKILLYYVAEGVFEGSSVHSLGLDTEKVRWNITCSGMHKEVGDLDYFDDPTHWMPLPPAPEVKDVE